MSTLDLGDDDHEDNNNNQRNTITTATSTTAAAAGLRRSDLSFLQARDPPLVPGFESMLNTSTTPRRVSDDDFANSPNENSTTMINTPPPPPSHPPQPQQRPQPQDQQESPTASCRGNYQRNKRYNVTRHDCWESNWDNFVIREIPIFYFVEPSSSVILHVSLHPPALVVQRISECLRCTSVQARYFADPAAAALLTLERVEMYLVLWLNHSNQLVVDLQRRRGDSSVFLRYCRLILSAAQGEFNAAAHEERVRNASLNSSRQETLKSAEMVLQHATTTFPATMQSAAIDQATFAATQDNEDSPNRSLAVVAMVSSLISKDDSDARHLGMETACILTDPRRTGISTAVMMSRVVVLGILPGDEGNTLSDVCKHIHLTLLMLVMTRNFPGKGTGNSTNSSSTNNSNSSTSNNIPMLLTDDEMDDYNECFFSDDEHPTEHTEFTSHMFHRALQVLANSLEVLANFENLELDGMISPEQFLQELVEAFVAHANRVVPENGNLIRTLVGECQTIEQQPHNAYLAAKILKYLCGASHSLVSAVLEERGLVTLSRAHQVGQKTHLYLELQTEQLLGLLQSNSGRSD